MMKASVFIVATLNALLLFHSSIHAQPACDVNSLAQLPNVTITSVTRDTQPVPHCKVSGVIGPEIRFDLVLPEE